MMGQPQQRIPKLFYAGVNLEERVPQDHLYRRMAAAVRFDAVRGIVADCYGHNGHESLDPVLVLKLLLIAYVDNVRSERELMKILPLRLDWLWFCELDLDSTIPDHSVLSKARRRWGEERFAALFADILRQCIQAGLVEGTTAFADSTLLKANADVASRLPRQLWRELEAAAGRPQPPDASEAQGSARPLPLTPAPGESAPHRGAPEVPETPTPEAPLPEAQASPVPTLAAAASPTLPALRLADRPQGLVLPPEPEGAFNRAWVSRTDPDAGTTKRRGRGITLGYRDHRLVDNRCGIILATVATGAHYHDAPLLPVLLDQAQELAGVKVQRVVGDSQYGSRENRQRLQRRHVQGYLKTCKTQGQADVHWSQLLPQGQDLATAARLFQRRQHVAEGGFAEAHQRMNHRRCRWRGRSNTQIQCYLTAMGQNMKKLARHGPKGRWPIASRIRLTGQIPPCLGTLPTRHRHPPRVRTRRRRFLTTAS